MSTIQDIYEEYENSARIAKTNSKSIKIYSSHASSGNLYFSSSKQGNFSSSTNYYNGLPKEAVFKVLNAGKKLKGRSVKNAIEYIARESLEFEKEFEKNHDKSNYKLALENQDGKLINSKEEISKLYKEWAQTFSKNENGVDAEHLLFSTAEKSNKKTNFKIMNAARETLKKQFGDEGYHYVFVLHTDKDHTHVHAIVRKYNTRTKQTLKLEKKDLWNTRKTWANELKRNGLNYEVSINMERIKSMTHKLEYVQTNNLSWFQYKVKTLNSENTKDLLKDLETTQEDIKKLERQRDTLKQTQKNIFYDPTQKGLNQEIKKDLEIINKSISNNYATSRAIIKKLNDLNFEVAAAVKAYKQLQTNKEKITGVLKLSSAYRNLDKQTKIAYESMMSKKLDLDKTQIYLSKLNNSKSYSINTNTELSYAFSNLKNIALNFERLNNPKLVTAAQKEIQKIQNSLNLSSTNLNKNTAKELNNLIKEFNIYNVLSRYDELCKTQLNNELIKHDNKEASKKILEKIQNGFDIYSYELKSLNLNVYNYSFRKENNIKECIYIDQSNKELIKNFLLESKVDITNDIFYSIEYKDHLFKYQFDKLDINTTDLLKKLKLNSFDMITTNDEILDFSKSYIDRQNEIIGDDFIKILKKIKKINSKIKTNDIFINEYINNIEIKFDNIIAKIETGNDIPIDHIKKIGLDYNEFETYDKIFKIDHIVSNSKNLTELEKLKPYFKDEIYTKLYQDIQENTLTNKQLELTFKNEKVTSLPINLKLDFEFEKKDISIEMITIDSIKKYLENDTNKNTSKESISNAIFNNKKLFNVITNRLENELGLEIKSANDLALNMHNIGKHSELRTLISKEIHNKINEFRSENNLNKNKIFFNYLNKINEKKESKKPITDKEKELSNLISFLKKNEDLYPIFESDLQKIDLNTLNFTDKTEVFIKVDVIPINDKTSQYIEHAFENMISNSNEKLKKIKINDTDLKAIQDLEKEYKIKSEFKDAANKYIKNAINKSETKKYLSATLDLKTLHSMQYMIQKDKIKEIPTNFLESRLIDTSNLPIKKVDKSVYSIIMGSKENLELFKNRDSQSIQHTGKKEFSNKPKQQREIDYINLYDPLKRTHLEEFRNSVIIAAKNKNLNELDNLYNSNTEYIKNNALLKKKFELYAEALEIKRDDIFNHILEHNDEIFKKEYYFHDDKKEDIFNEISEIHNINELDKYLLYAKSLGIMVDEAYSLKVEDIDKQVNMTLESGELYISTQKLIDKKNELDKLNTISNSRLISFREITDNDTAAINFLKNRGINKIPKNLYLIEGENSGIGKNGKSYTIKNIGVGVINGDMSKDIDISKQGADIHLLKPIKLKDGSLLKTVSYGSKDFTLIPGKNEKAVAVFESKMDYAAAIQQINLSDRTVIIANGTGNATKIANWINQNSIEKVTFFNQNDNAGIKFIDDLSTNTNTKKFNYIKYESNEYKMDINDLVEKGSHLKSRFKRGDINDFLIDHGEEPKNININKLNITHVEKLSNKDILNFINNEFSQQDEKSDDIPGEIKKIQPNILTNEVQKKVDKLTQEIKGYQNRSKELSNKITEMGEEGSLEKLNITEKIADKLEIQYNIEINEISYKVEKLQNELSHLQPEDLGNKKINELTPDLLPENLIKHITKMSQEEKEFIKQENMTVNETIEHINNQNKELLIPKDNIQRSLIKEELTKRDMPILNVLPKHDKKIKLNHEKLKQEEQQKTKELFNKIKSIIEIKELKENQKINSYTLNKKEDILKISNRLITNLNKNYYDIKNTQVFIKNLNKNSKSYTNDLAVLSNSINHYKKISKELNINVNEFISNVQNSKLNKTEKIEVLHTMFEKLEDKKYHENILNVTDDKSIKEELTKRDIEHIKTITKKIEQLSYGHKMIDKKLLSTSKDILNRLDNQKLSITQSLRLKNLKKKQNELTSKNLGKSLQLI
ncbi:MAG: toprim domain-containing protein [Arcobacteraceae bacterium]